MLQHLLGAAVKRQTAGEKQVQHNAETEDVGPAIDAVSLAVGLFGTHERWRSGHARTLAEIFLLERQPKIRQVRLARIVDQDVRRLDVAMDQSVLMSVLES